MSIACWIPKATNTNSENVILIAFILQQWLHEHASILRYLYNACLVNDFIDHLTCVQTLVFQIFSTNVDDFANP